MISDVDLDRICSEDRFTRLNPPCVEPDFMSDDVERLSVVEEDGTVRERQFLEDVQWWRVVAIRGETSFGVLIEDPFDEQVYWGEY